MNPKGLHSESPLKPAHRSKSRPRLIKLAYDRSFYLVLRNPEYLKMVETLVGGLLREDAGAGDVTTNTLLSNEKAKAFIIAKDDGILAGGDEFAWLCGQNGVAVSRIKNDGEKFRKGDKLFKLDGPKRSVFLIERTGLNLLQRMSGIATATSRLAGKVRRAGHGVVITGTRKTPWGLLDKKAVTLGSGYSHRLGLFESFLIKDNHIDSLRKQGVKNPVEFALEKAWELRRRSVFIEIETRSRSEAMRAARKFRKLQDNDKEIKACIIMLDNMPPADVRKTVLELKRRKLYDYVLLEASGNVDEKNVVEYAKAGVDACSLGEITHSAKAIDISQKIL